MSELDALAADLRWMRKNMESHDTILVNIFERLRKIETDIAAIEAKQRPPISGWAVMGICASIIATALIILDRIYVNQ